MNVLNVELCNSIIICQFLALISHLNGKGATLKYIFDGKKVKIVAAVIFVTFLKVSQGRANLISTYLHTV